MDAETQAILWSAIILPLLTAITTFIVKYINAKAEMIKTQTNDQKTKELIGIAERAIMGTVLAVNQSFVDTLKYTGGWNEATAKQAFTLAKDNVIKLLTPEIKEALRVTFADTDKWVDTMIEFYVKRLKPGANNSAIAVST